MNIPDTEWEKLEDKAFIAYGIAGQPTVKVVMLSDAKQSLTSRDTYWKERVRKDLDRRLEIQEKVLHSEYEGGYTQALKDVKEAHFTNEDNLK